jgi:alkylation response protein AidB-like acyl-CoA dehydrogenase
VSVILAPISEDKLEVLRAELRGFLATKLAEYPAERRARSWMAVDPEFSREMGRRGWIGMTWPKRYGGHERRAMERYTVLEEMLAAGAPVGAHWTADRQSGPLLLRFGTEEQRSLFLPAMARGELYFCIGMSEPQAGSDLAAVKTRAIRDRAGWRVTGSKLWTTNANLAHMMITLVRTGEGSQRHEGLSQLIVDLAAPGVTVKPIMDLAGDSHFNEVFLDDVFVPDSHFVGEEGGGWQQVMSELALERSGPERYLSSVQALVALLTVIGPQPEEPMRGLVGNLTARLWALRQMSRQIAVNIEAGEDAALDAAIVKSLGADLEQDMPRDIQEMLDDDDDLTSSGDLAQVLSLLLKVSPSFSLRGGTREILKGIVARGIGLR